MTLVLKRLLKFEARLAVATYQHGLRGSVVARAAVQNGLLADRHGYGDWPSTGESMPRS